jgi:ElaB/YqjD/DUF883 family membrane-anchored ribosome-binding protein
VTDGHDMTWDGSDRAADPEQSSDALVEDIEATRDAMTDTVQAIGDRLSPTNIVADAKSTVREATVGKVEDMAQSAGQALGEAGSTAQYAGTTIVETIKRNPIPAAMAAIGIGWLATHSSSGQRRSWGDGVQGWGDDRQRWGDRYRGSGATYGGQWDTERFSSGGSSGGPAQALSEVGDTVSQKASEVGDTLGQVPEEMRYRAQSFGDQAGRFMEESPLVAGAVAVAVGAVIGSMLPSTQMEQRVLGPATERVIDTAEQAATQTMSEMEQQATSGSTGSTSGSSSSNQGQGQSLS